MFIRISGLWRKHSDNVLKLFPFSKYVQDSFTSGKLYLFFINQVLVHSVLGRSINVKSAGLVGRHGPQSKQPFMVAFFKASEVLLRSVRAANKRKNQNRNKSSSHQDSSRMSSVGGKIKPEQQLCTESYGVTCCKSSSHNKFTLWMYTFIWFIKSSSNVSSISRMFHQWITQ